LYEYIMFLLNTSSNLPGVSNQTTSKDVNHENDAKNRQKWK